MKKLILLFLLLFSQLTVKAETIPTQAPTTGIYDGEYILPTELSGKVTVCKNLTETEEHISQNHL